MVTLINNSTQKALTTLSRLKLYLGISSDAQDQTLTLLINMATGYIERYTKRSLSSQAYSNEVYDGKNSRVIVLNNWPVTAFSSLAQNLSGDASEDWETINPVDYFWYTDGRVVANSFTFIDVPKKYRASYTAGYLIDFDNENDVTKHTLPQELEYACMKLCSAVLNTRKADGISSERVGDLSVSYSGATARDVEISSILEKYTKPTI